MRQDKVLGLWLACVAILCIPCALRAAPLLSYTSSSGDPSVSQPTSQGWSYEGTNGTGFVSASGGNPAYLDSSGSSTAWVSPEFTAIPNDYYQISYTYVDQQSAPQTTKGYVATFGANPSATYDLEQTNNPEYWRTNGSAQSVTAPILYSGQLLHDDYNGVQPTGASFTTASTIWQAPQNATNGFVVFQGAFGANNSTNPLEIQSMSVMQVSASAVLAWTSNLQGNLLQFKTTPSFNLPANRFTQLPHTFAKLATGQPLKIAIMTDSIGCDAENSLFNTLVQSDHPGSQITLYNATGHGTSTTAWMNPVAGNSTTGGLDLTNAVIKQNPDLVIIGGISSMGTSLTAQSIKDFTNITTALRAANPSVDILYMTGDDWDMEGSTQVHDYTANSSNVYGAVTFTRAIASLPTNDYRYILSQQAAADGVGFFDLYGERGNYLMNEFAAEQAANPTLTQSAFFDALHRDITHSNDYGKNIDAQVLEAYFSSAVSVPEPTRLALVGFAAALVFCRPRRRQSAAG